LVSIDLYKARQKLWDQSSPSFLSPRMGCRFLL